MNSTLTSAGPEHMTRIRDISAQERGERGDFCMRPWYGVGKVRAVPPHVGRQPKPLHTAGDHPAMPSGTHGRWKDWGRAKSGGEGHDAAHLPFSWTSAEFAATSFLLPCFGRAAMARARGGESIENDARKQSSDRILIQGGHRGAVLRVRPRATRTRSVRVHVRCVGLCAVHEPNRNTLHI